MKTLMTGTILALIITLVAQTNSSQQKTPSPAVEEHVRDVVRELPTDSALRKGLLQGARGNGVHYGWMDEMRKQGVKRAVVWIDIRFNRKGHPKKMNLNRAEYFAQYEGGTPISDSAQLEIIRMVGLEKDLGAIALEKAKHGFWCDVPRPRPHPFVGGTRIEFLDDEWLPALSGALYFASNKN